MRIRWENQNQSKLHNTLLTRKYIATGHPSPVNQVREEKGLQQTQLELILSYLVFCYDDPVDGGCRNITINEWFFNRNFSRCDVFTCGEHVNKFLNNEECMGQCTGLNLVFQQSYTLRHVTSKLTIISNKIICIL